MSNPSTALNVAIAAEIRSREAAYSLGRRTAESGLPPSPFLVQSSSSYTAGYRDWYVTNGQDWDVADLEALHARAEQKQLSLFNLSGFVADTE